MTSLPRPEFAIVDPQASLQEVIALWEEMTGKTLYPAQYEYSIFEIVAYIESVVKASIQYAGEQNLVNYAAGTNLDELGEFWAEARLQPARALTTLQFTLSGVKEFAVLVPAGTRVRPEGQNLLFETTEDLTIPAGEPTGSVTGQATEAGIAYNELTIGKIDRLFDVIANVESVTNTTVTTGGTNRETDERYRFRLKLAPNKLSVAGSSESYYFHAYSSDPSIIDVAVESPFRVQVRIYILTDVGLPSTELREKVYAALSSNRVRPLTDRLILTPAEIISIYGLDPTDVEATYGSYVTVEDQYTIGVLSPTEIAFVLEANVTLLTTVDTIAMQSLLEEAAAAKVQQMRSVLGHDIIRSQLIAALSIEGTYNVEIVQPASDLELTKRQWANCTSITINVVGVEVG